MKLGSISVFALASLLTIAASPARASDVTAASSVVHRDADVNCANLIDKLKALRTSTQNVGSEVVRIVNDSAQVMSSWYGQLHAYEGQSVYIGYGAFDNMSQSASTEATNASTFQSDFNTLDSNLADILVALPGCLKAN